MANESNSKFIKLVSTGLIDLHLTLTLTDQEANSFNVFPSKINKMTDCASFLSSQGANLFMTSSQIESKKLNIYDHIRLSSNNSNINTLLVLNRAFKKKIFVEYVTMNEIRFFPEDFFMKDVLKYVTEQNFLFLVENKFLKNSLSQIKFEIKINNKTVKLFENICDNNSNYDNSIQVDELKSDSNTNLNNFNINLNNFNNSNTNYDINNNANIENNVEPIVNLIENSKDDVNAAYNNSNNNVIINQSNLKTSSINNNKINEMKEKTNEQIDFSINHNENSLALANKSSNIHNKSKVTTEQSINSNNNNNNNYNSNKNQIEKETSRNLLENDLLQQNNNSKSVSKRLESKNQRSLAENSGNINLLDNIDNTPERLKSKTNTNPNNNINNNEDNNMNLDMRTNSNKYDLIAARKSGDINFVNQEAFALEGNQMGEEFGKADGVATENKLLNSFENKFINDSNINHNNNNNISSKILNQNNNSQIGNKSNNKDNYFNENENENNFAEEADTNNNNNNNLGGLQHKSSFGFGAGINDLINSPNTNFTNTLIKLQKSVFELFRYDFNGCNYFFVDLNEIISLQNFNFSLKEFLELLRRITADYREISVITTFPSIIKNIALLDLESLSCIAEIVNLTDIYLFEKKEALALLNLLAQLNSESDSVEEKKNLEFLFIREIKRKKRPHPKLGLFLEGLKKCTIIQQQQNSNLVVFHTDYEFNLIPPNVSSVVFEDYQKILSSNSKQLASVFLGGFLSRFLYRKSFNTCFTAGNESLKRITELHRFSVEPPLDFNYYLIRLKKSEKGPSEAQKAHKKKEKNFVLDSTNVVNSKMREYNPLYDGNLVSFFSSKLTRSHLQKSGFINRNGCILDDPENKKITMLENSAESKNFEKIYEQEKNNLLKIKEQKEKMRLQIKSLMSFNSQTLRAGNFKELDKLAKIYTFNPVLNKKLPTIDLKKSSMKTTKFNNNLFLKEISKGNKPKSLFNFHPDSNNQKGSNNDIEILQKNREKSTNKEKVSYTNVNSINRVTSYNNSKNKNLTGKSKERENSANYFNNSTNNNNNNNRVKSGNNSFNKKISGASRQNSDVIVGTAEDNKRVDSHYSSKNNLKSENNLFIEAEIKEENILNVNVNEENGNMEVNQNENNESKAKEIFEAEANAKNAAQNLNSSKLSVAKQLDLTSQSAAVENQPENKSQIINGSENQEEPNNSNNIIQQEEKQEEQHYSFNGENNSNINNLSRNQNKNSSADLDVSKRSRKFEVNNNNNNDFENSKRSKTEENLLRQEINPNKLIENDAAANKENSAMKIDSKRSYEKDKEIDLKDAVSSGNEEHPNQID